jgi:hypothetical protein
MNGDSSVGTATGFFYRDDNRVFLITNKHVVTYSLEEKKPNLVLVLHTNQNNPSQTATLRIPLFENSNRRWYQYDDVDIDIAAIPIERNILSTVYFVSFSEVDFPPKGIEFSVGEDLLAVGFPRGFHDQKNFIPVVRNCTVATPISVPFEGAPLMLIDGTFHPGMSGSPVVTKPSSVHNITGGISFGQSSQSFLVGIHSFSVHKKVGEAKEPVYGIQDGKVVIRELKTVDVTENLGLHSCWFNGVIAGLVKQISK